MLIWLCGTLGSAAHADTFDSQGLTGCGEVIADKALDGARFTVSGGATVKLALIKAPELWEKASPYKSWPHAEAAKEALRALIEGQSLTLFCEGPKTNRFEEIVAHALLPDGRWLQHDLVANGNAIVFPRPTRRRGLTTLFKAEDSARERQVGLWAFDNFKSVDALSDQVKTGWFQIITGTVLKADKVGPTVYLNFGADWRSDFTVEIPTSALRHFEKAGIDPLLSAGKRIEVRGWVDYKAGPRILIQGPGQLRILE